MRHAAAVLLLLALLLLPGCGRGETGEGPYDVYFLTLAEGQTDALVPESRRLAPGEDPVEGLLNCLLEGPADESLTRTIPQGVEVRDWSLKNGLLTLDFTNRYAGLSGVALTLADYSVVLTLSQLEGVDTVMILADGELIPYRDHQRLAVGDLQALGMAQE